MYLSKIQNLRLTEDGHVGKLAIAEEVGRLLRNGPAVDRGEPPGPGEAVKQWKKSAYTT